MVKKSKLGTVLGACLSSAAIVYGAVITTVYLVQDNLINVGNSDTNGNNNTVVKLTLDSNSTNSIYNILRECQPSSKNISIDILNSKKNIDAIKENIATTLQIPTSDITNVVFKLVSSSNSLVSVSVTFNPLLQMTVENNQQFVFDEKTNTLTTTSQSNISFNLPININPEQAETILNILNEYIQSRETFEQLTDVQVVGGLCRYINKELKLDGTDVIIGINFDINSFNNEINATLLFNNYVHVQSDKFILNSDQMSILTAYPIQKDILVNVTKLLNIKYSDFSRSIESEMKTNNKTLEEFAISINSPTELRKFFTKYTDLINLPAADIQECLVNTINEGTIKFAISFIGNKYAYFTISISDKNVVINGTELVSLGTSLQGQTTIDLSNYNIESIANNCFSFNNTIQTIKLPSSLKSIGVEAFAACTSLTDIVLPGSVVSIGSKAFAGCNKLQNVSFDGNSFLDSIGDSAFSGCSSLTIFNIPTNVSILSENAFSNCSSLKTITFGAGSHLKMISKNAFSGCGNLACITIPSSVISIQDQAFIGCHSLAQVDFETGSLLTEIGKNAFTNSQNVNLNNCTNLDESLISIIVTQNPQAKFIKDNIGVINVLNLGTITAGDTTFINGTTLTIPSYVNSITGQLIKTLREKITAITFESTRLTYIDDSAFSYCTKLNNVTIPDSVLNIGEYVFNGCSSLTTVTFNATSNLEYISENAFSSCTSLSTVTLPSSITSIGTSAFDGCTSLATIDLSQLNKLNTIDNYAFKGCSALTTITLPDTVVTLGDGVFLNCTAFNSIAINATSSLKTIGSQCFMNSGITSFKITPKLVEIQNQAFYGSSIANLVTVDNSNNYVLQNIGTSAFESCAALSSVTLPTSLMTINDSAFKNCAILNSVQFGTNSNLAVIGNHAFDTCPKLIDITIPANVRKIGDYAFNCRSTPATVPPVVGTPPVADNTPPQSLNIGLSSITFESNSQLRLIGNHAFDYTNIQQISIPDSVELIGDSAFESVISLTTVTISNRSRLSTIGANAFKWTGIISINIPSSTNLIATSAFEYCQKLTTVTFSIGNKLETIGSNVFANCSLLDQINIPASVKTIGNGAFLGSSLTKLTFADNSNLTTIAANAFKQSKLISITIPESTSTIGANAFDGCTALKSVAFVPGCRLKTIQQLTFNGCTSIANINIPSNVEVIEANAFQGCTGLLNVTFGNNSLLQQVATDAFPNTSGLTIDMSNCNVIASSSVRKLQETISKVKVIHPSINNS